MMVLGGRLWNTYPQIEFSAQLLPHNRLKPVSPFKCYYFEGRYAYGIDDLF